MQTINLTAELTMGERNILDELLRREIDRLKEIQSPRNKFVRMQRGERMRIRSRLHRTQSLRKALGFDSILELPPNISFIRASGEKPAFFRRKRATVKIVPKS